MKYEHIHSIATDWCLQRYYKLPHDMQFSVEWQYSEDKYDFNYKPFRYKRETTTVNQKACYAVVTIHRSDGSFFNFQLLDEDMVTIRGKHCKGNAIYMQIYNELVRGNH